MKRMTATDARKSWFRLLDEVLAGEVVVIERAGQRIFIRRDSTADSDTSIPDYAEILEVPDAAEANRWGWIWDGPEEGLRPVADPEAP